ncbi:MAG: hypothetical protein M3R16_04610 [Pseudomonadota bacterium]|nr:hypothetical protein [Pseudomonadota bacterium]
MAFSARHNPRGMASHAYSTAVTVTATCRHELCAATGKVRLVTAAKAYAVAKEMRRKHKSRTQAGQLHAYRCERCCGWHCGHRVEGCA